MAKRIINGRNDSESSIESIRSNPLEIEGVWLQSLVPAKVKIKGYSGTEYIFDGAGSVQYVNEEDVNGLLSKMRPSSCCGANLGPQPYFVLLKAEV